MITEDELTRIRSIIKEQIDNWTPDEGVIHIAKKKSFSGNSEKSYLAYNVDAGRYQEISEEEINNPPEWLIQQYLPLVRGNHEKT